MRIEGYKDVEPLASGATSDTYRARLPASDRWLAVKVFRFALADDRDERRFLHALEPAQELSAHPRLATIYDAGLTVDRQPYVTMQLVPGGSAADRLTLASHGPFPPADGLRLAIQACEALEVTHDAGLIHRFVQPTNLLLPAADRVVLSEVGVPLFVERWEASGYLDSAVPFHAAPEVLEREAAGPAADVYSLASTLYTLLAGRPPRQDPAVVSVPSLLLHVLRQEPPVLAGPSVPDSLSAVLAAALAPDPDQRTGQARTFREALEAALADVERAGSGPAVKGHPSPSTSEAAADPGAAADRGAGHPIDGAPGAGEPGTTTDTGPGHHDQVDTDDTGPVPEPVVSAALPARVPGTGLEPVDPAAGPAPRTRRYRAAGLTLAGGVAMAVGILIGGLGSDADDDAPGNPAGEATRGTAATSVPSDGESEPVDGDAAGNNRPEGVDRPGPDPTDGEVPTGFEVSAGEAGVLLSWDRTDSDRFVILTLSENGPPVLEAVTGSSRLLDLDADDGYCFAVARQDMIGATGADGMDGADPTASDEGADEPSDMGRWFTPLNCTGSASADTVRFGP